MTRVLLADDQELVRAGFRLILSERELEVLAKLGLRDRVQASSRPGAVSPE